MPQLHSEWPRPRTTSSAQHSRCWGATTASVLSLLCEAQISRSGAVQTTPPPPPARQILGNHLLMNSENKCVMTYGSVVRESGARRFWCSEWGFGSEESRCSKDVCLSTYGNILLPCEQKLIFIPERVVETFWGHLLPRADSAPTGDDDIPPLRSHVCRSSFSWNKLNSINPAELHSQLSKHRRQAGHCCTDESGNDITLEARSNSWLQKSQQ